MSNCQRIYLFADQMAAVNSGSEGDEMCEQSPANVRELLIMITTLDSMVGTHSCGISAKRIALRTQVQSRSLLVMLSCESAEGHHRCPSKNVKLGRACGDQAL